MPAILPRRVTERQLFGFLNEVSHGCKEDEHVVYRYKLAGVSGAVQAMGAMRRRLPMD